MAPAQPLMELEADQKPQINVEFLHDKEIKSFVANSDMKGLTCGSNCEDTITRIEDRIEDKNNAPENVDIDGTECRTNSDIRLVKTEDPNATEYSSSFDDTADNAENYSGFSEGEVESQFFGDNGFGSAFDTFDSVFRMRKKKLTNHWRNYIRPVMWRCKWMELRMKDIDTQVLKYARELEAYDRGKHSGLEQFNSEELCSKSLPLKSQYSRKRAMKRRRRKRVEARVDIATYMAQHNLYSYLENKRSDPENACLAEEFGNAVNTEQSGECNEKLGSYEWTPFETKDGDFSMEQFVFRIEKLHSWVKKLKSQMETLISNNLTKLCSSENLSLVAPVDVQTSSAHSPAFSTGNGDAISPGPMYDSAQHLTDYDISDLVLPETVVSSFVEAITVPDIIESTVGLLWASNVTLHQPKFGDSNEDIVENVLMDENEEIGEVGEIQEDVKPCLIPIPIQSSSSNSENNAMIPSIMPQLSSSCFNFPLNKRKRGERKPASASAAASASASASLVWEWNNPASTDTRNQLN